MLTKIGGVVITKEIVEEFSWGLKYCSILSSSTVVLLIFGLF